MSRSKYQRGRLNAKRKGDWRRRVNRLGRHIRWKGRRLAKTDEPFDVQVLWPRNVMSQNTAADVAEWVLQTPNRWWMRVEVHCEGPTGDAYIEAFDFDSGQQVTADELGDWRKERIEEAKANLNARHVWLEAFETGIH